METKAFQKDLDSEDETTPSKLLRHYRIPCRDFRITRNTYEDISSWVWPLLMSLQDVVFLHPELVFPQHFIKNVVKVKAAGQHALKLWLEVSKGILHVKYIRSKEISFLCLLNLSQRLW